MSSNTPNTRSVNSGNTSSPSNASHRPSTSSNSSAGSDGGRASPTMSTLIRIAPQGFQFTASKHSSGQVSKLKMKNLWSTPVGYKFKTNAPLRYSVKPVLGVMAPGQTIEVFVRCESWVNPQDRFLLQSIALSEAESEKIDSISWRALDARRIVETYIQCSSASPLSLKDQHDDNSSVSSRSSMSSTRSSGSSRSSPSPSRTQSRTTSRTQPVPLRKSSAASGGPTPPGSYPTLFGADKKGSGRVSSSAQTIKSGTSIARGGSSSTLTSPASSSSSLWSSLSDLRQSLKTLRTFLAVRQYTKLQVVMVSIVCLLVGLLLPFERLFVMVGTEPNLIRPSAGVVTAAAAAPIRSGVDKSDTNNAAVLKFVDRRKNVVAITNKAVMEALRDPAAAVVLVDPKSKPSGDTRQPDPEGSV